MDSFVFFSWNWWKISTLFFFCRNLWRIRAVHFFFISGHVQLRHKDVIKYSQCILWYLENFKNTCQRGQKYQIRLEITSVGFWIVSGYHMTFFVRHENSVLTWTEYSRYVIVHDRKLKNKLPNTNWSLMIPK